MNTESTKQNDSARAPASTQETRAPQTDALRVRSNLKAGPHFRNFHGASDFR